MRRRQPGGRPASGSRSQPHRPLRPSKTRLGPPVWWYIIGGIVFVLVLVGVIFGIVTGVASLRPTPTPTLTATLTPTLTPTPVPIVATLTPIPEEAVSLVCVAIQETWKRSEPREQSVGRGQIPVETQVNVIARVNTGSGVWYRLANEPLPTYVLAAHLDCN